MTFARNIPRQLEGEFLAVATWFLFAGPLAIYSSQNNIYFIEITAAMAANINRTTTTQRKN